MSSHCPVFDFPVSGADPDVFHMEGGADDLRIILTMKNCH